MQNNGGYWAGEICKCLDSEQEWTGKKCVKISKPTVNAKSREECEARGKKDFKWSWFEGCINLREEECANKGDKFSWDKKKRECVPAKESSKKPCPEWKKHPAFGRNGRVSKSFCKDFAKNKRECEKALDRMKKLLKRLDEMESQKNKGRR